MGRRQTDEEQEYTELWYEEKVDELKMLFDQRPCPIRNRTIRDKLEEMIDNLEYLQMR
jgi:hypothetical protein